MNRKVFLALFSLVFGLFPAGAAGPKDLDFGRYKAMNEAETRLSEYKDDDEALRLKLEMLAVVNASRARFKAKPLELDILASRVANKQSREGAEKGFTGHWNSAGEKPYHRWAFAGGYDHVSENAGALWASAILDPAKGLEFVKSIHANFMAEPAGADGHKLNIINPVHTHVGLGLAFSGKQFRYYEEYLDRYIDFLEVPSEVETGGEALIRIKPAEKLWLYAAIVYYEALPKPMTVAALNAKGAYPDFTDSQSFKDWPPFDREEDGSYVLTLKGFAKPGLYYVQLYLDSADPSKAKSFSTTGKIQASGIVIKVKG